MNTTQTFYQGTENCVPEDMIKSFFCLKSWGIKMNNKDFRELQNCVQF